MIIIIILLFINIYLYKLFKQKKQEIENNNISFMKKRKNHHKIKNYNIKIRIFLFNIVFISIWLLISFFINKTLLNNFEKSLDSGLLTYNIIKKDALQKIEDKEDKEIYVYGYKVDTKENRAYYYILSDNTKISKSLSNAIKLNPTIEKTNFQTEGNLIYDKFLKLFFFQFYSYQYKQVYCQEENILFLDFEK